MRTVVDPLAEYQRQTDDADLNAGWDLYCRVVRALVLTAARDARFKHGRAREDALEFLDFFFDGNQRTIDRLVANAERWVYVAPEAAQAGRQCTAQRRAEAARRRGEDAQN